MGEVCVLVLSRGFVCSWGCLLSRCLCMSMVASIGFQLEAAVYRCL